MNLISLFKKFPTQESCIEYLEQVRWGDKIVCPYCESDKTCRHNKSGRQNLQCWNCQKSFSVTVGTIFHHTHFDLRYWFYIICMMLNAKKGISACQIAREINSNRPTVWRVTHKIRKAMQTEQKEMLQGIFEMDETYIRSKRKDDEDDNDFHSGSKRAENNVSVVAIKQKGGDIKAIATQNTNFLTLSRQ
jgi:transposase-like protein